MRAVLLVALVGLLSCAAPESVRPSGPISDDADGDLCRDVWDCAPMDPLRHRGAFELCNGLDDDCDGSLPDVEIDRDGDGRALCNGDCIEDDRQSHPDALEVCDGLDNDCASGVPPVERDGDADGVRVCEGDCDDEDPRRQPGNSEGCDGVDSDCDGVVPAEETLDLDGDASPACEDCADDDGSRDGTDKDGDGVTTCDQPSDCADDESRQSPSHTEYLCDGLDNDCDPSTDEAADNDGDGHSVACGGGLRRQRAGDLAGQPRPLPRLRLGHRERGRLSGRV